MKRLLLIFLLILFSIVMSSKLLLDNDDEEEYKRQSRQTYKDPFKDLTFTFSCNERPSGFYADIEHGCKIFHVCSEKGDRMPVLCPHQTLFDQRQRMCTDEVISCDQSERWYYLDKWNYYSYFVAPKKNTEVTLEEIDAYTVIPLEAD